MTTLMNTPCFIYDAIRTPRGKGKSNGALHEVSTLRLLSGVLKEIAKRNEISEDEINDVVAGVVDPVGEAGGNVARAAAIAAGLGVKVPGIQINRFCASGLDAVNLAAAKVMSGQDRLVIGAGVESMSRVGIGASGGAWPIDPFIALPSYFMPQGVSADLIATKYGFTRKDVDTYALESQRRASNAWKEGRFNRSVVPVRDLNDVVILDKDEHIRPDTTLESLSKLSPSFRMYGEMGGFDAVALQRYPELEGLNYVHHAGNSSGIVDGAAAVLLGARGLGIKPRAKILGFKNIGSEPGIMLTGPVDVTNKLLWDLGMTPKDIDLFEVNEAFASVVLRYIQAFNLDPSKVNVNGGAIAMGHPLGATGAMLISHALDELERTNKQTALITLCIGAGMGTALVIERA